MLIIDGNLYEVQTTGASEKYIAQGEVVRTIVGSLKSSIIGDKRQWNFISGPLTEAEYQVLRISNNRHRDCSGDALGGVTVPCAVSIGNGAYLNRAGIDHLRIATIRLDEI